MNENNMHFVMFDKESTSAHAKKQVCRHKCYTQYAGVRTKPQSLDQTILVDKKNSVV